MIFWSVLLASALLPLVSASPHRCRSSPVCGQYDSVTSYPYSLLANHWGTNDVNSGSQCSTLKSINGNVVKWSTQWSWSGNGIKSFSNIQLNKGLNQQLSAISTMPSTWNWSQSSTGNVVSDVAYDLFTSYTAGGSNVNEVMIWLGNFNAGPIAYQYDASGHAIPTAKNLAIAGYTWNLYEGSNGQNAVYSFLPVSGNINSFSGDIYDFFKYLIQTGCITSSQYLVTAQAGTEATSGTAKLTTSYYELSIN